MEELRYDVLLTGTTLYGRPVEDAAADLAKLIRRDVEFARRLLQGRPVKVRSDVDRDTADRYVQSLAKLRIGTELQVSGLPIDPEVDSPPIPVLIPSAATTSEPAPQSDAEAVASPAPDAAVAIDPRWQRVTSLPNALVVALFVAELLAQPAAHSFSAYGLGRAMGVIIIPFLVTLTWNLVRRDITWLRRTAITATIIFSVIWLAALLQGPKQEQRAAARTPAEKRAALVGRWGCTIGNDVHVEDYRADGTYAFEPGPRSIYLPWGINQRGQLEEASILFPDRNTVFDIAFSEDNESYQQQTEGGPVITCRRQH